MVSGARCAGGKDGDAQTLGELSVGATPPPILKDTKMTIKLSSLKADIVAEREGQWIEPKDWPGLGALPGLAFLVRSTQYPPYLSARAAAQQRLAKKFDDGNVPPEELARADGTLAVEHLLMGWRGFDIPYAKDAAEQVLTDEAHRTLRDIVFWCATKVGKRDVEFMETEGKNSGPSSATS